STNWWAYGNQRNFDISFRPRFVSNVQVNPLKQANSTGNVPSNISSAINFSINPAKFDVATRTYVSANLRAVRVTGPGLPTAGVVFAPSSASGATSFLAVHNKTGVVDTSTMSVNSTSNNFTLGAVASDGSSLYSGFWNAANVGNLDAPLTDYSALQAYSAYQFEYFLNSNPGNTTPDAIETARILAPVMSPSAVRSIPLNDFSPSQSLVTAPAAGGCSFTLNWSNNANASPVSNVFIYGQTNTAAGLSRYLITSNVNASLVGTRPSSSSLTAANCATGAIPALSATAGSSDFRQIGLGMTQARYQYYTYMQWNN
ncbi:MAG: hypothetical protein RLZZ401_1624, partial [Pseudomonadota bacterium]